MNISQFIYFSAAPREDIQSVLERTLSFSMIKVDNPDWFFYYEDKKIEISVGLPYPSMRIISVKPCSKPFKIDIKIVIQSNLENIIAADLAAAKCVNAILQAFDLSLIFMSDDGTLRLVRCEDQVFIDWPESSEAVSFWNRPNLKIIDTLTVSYKRVNLAQSF